MRILLLSQYFYPEVGATQTRMMEFARALASAGHEVDVLTEFPNHPLGVIPDSYRGRWIEVDQTLPFRIIRVRVSASPVKTLRTRLMFYGSFLVMALAASLRLHRRYDVVAATSPPLPAALAGELIARMKRAAFVMDVRDLWPLAAKALNELSNERMYRLAERLERYLYAHADRITVTTRAFEKHVAAFDPDRTRRVEYVPNGTVVEVFDPARGDDGIRRRLGLDGRFVVGYAGLHGVAQGLSTIVDAAQLLAGDPRIRFLLVGDGPLKAALVAQAKAANLTSIAFVDQVPLEVSACYMNACDALLVPLVPDPVFRMFVPSKLFDSMACAKPVLLSVDGEAREILAAAAAGVFVEPGNAAALAAAIRGLAADRAGSSAMGARGRAFVQQHYQRRDQARRFTAILESAAAGRAGGRVGFAGAPDAQRRRS
jgi:glycosyltransferase involved in cell wall biosynthesis